MTTRIYWLHTLSPTHVGTGRGVGYIDLPIDRDGVTGWPLVRASAFKGVWSDHWNATDQARSKDDDNGRRLKAAFGIADGDQSCSGSLVPSDAQLVALPVRSFRGTFAWCTSPLCLQMLRRTLELAGEQGLPEAPTELDQGKAHHAEGAVLTEQGKIFLEDLDFEAVACKVASAWARRIAEWVFPSDQTWQTVFEKRFVVVPDLAFDFLTETGTEVHTRVRIRDDTKTVETGALWTEESLPAETILAGIIRCDRVFGSNGQDITPENLAEEFAQGTLRLQIGGKATVGRGQVRCVFTPLEQGGP